MGEMCASPFNLTRTEMKPKVGLITLQMKNNLSAFEIYLRLLKVLEPLSMEIVWVATNYLGDDKRLPAKVTLKKLESGDIDKGPFLKRIPSYLWREIKITLEMVKLRDVDVIIFYCGYLPLFPVLFTALFLKGKTILRIDGRSSVIVKLGTRPDARQNRLIRIIIHSLIERIDYSLADRIAVEYASMVERYNLQKYLRKIVVGNQYIDTDLFKQTKGLTERSYQMGYFGRFSDEKGILELARALSLILKDEKSRAIIVGDGELYEHVASILTDTGIRSKVELVRWIRLDEMPAYLNNTRMVVVPSYEEGMPNVVLEAMACGTLVLATPVGGIPEVIRDGETGFIMEDNSPACIARNISRVLNHPDLEEITRKARALVEKEYAYEVVLEKYRNTIAD
jgi:glycosyltransferase involved in cell wall biosynthesis